MPSTSFFNEMCVKITLLRSITKNLTGVCNGVYFQLCIDLMHITPPVTAKGYDGSRHPRYAKWSFMVLSASLTVHTYRVRQRLAPQHSKKHKSHALANGDLMHLCDAWHLSHYHGRYSLTEPCGRRPLGYAEKLPIAKSLLAKSACMDCKGRPGLLLFFSSSCLSLRPLFTQHASST